MSYLPTPNIRFHISLFLAASASLRAFFAARFANFFEEGLLGYLREFIADSTAIVLLSNAISSLYGRKEQK